MVALTAILLPGQVGPCVGDPGRLHQGGPLPDTDQACGQDPAGRVCREDGTLWSSPLEDDHYKQEGKSRRASSVQDIFTWLQCYGLFVSLLEPQHPSRISKLMAYQVTIVQASQDYEGLAWEHHDSPVSCDSVGNQPNPVYPLHHGVSLDIVKVQTLLHRILGQSSKQCSMTSGSGPSAAPPHQGGPVRAPLGQVCRLWNDNRCTFKHCRIHMYASTVAGSTRS